MLPDPLLERLHADDGDAEPARTKLLSRASPGEIEEALQRLAVSDQEILARYPPRVAMVQLEGQLRSRRRRRLQVVGSLLAAALVLVALTLRPPGPDVPTERAKGPPLLSVLVEGRPSPLRDGAIGREGDRLQLVLDPSGAAHAAVVSVDGRGTVTVHFPRQGQDTRLPTPGALPLDRSFRLDDAPSFEVFYAITSDRPLDLPTVLQAAEQGGPDRWLDLDGVDQTRFVVRKP